MGLCLYAVYAVSLRYASLQRDRALRTCRPGAFAWGRLPPSAVSPRFTTSPGVECWGLGLDDEVDVNRRLPVSFPGTRSRNGSSRKLASRLSNAADTTCTQPPRCGKAAGVSNRGPELGETMQLEKRHKTVEELRAAFPNTAPFKPKVHSLQWGAS